jgi:hypothetical protein
MSGLHVILRVIGQGYGCMPAADYEEIPEAVRDRVELLAVAPNAEKARWIVSHLPQDWRDLLLAWDPDNPGPTAVIEQ